jgi:hypothetical protein
MRTLRPSRRELWSKAAKKRRKAKIAETTLADLNTRAVFLAQWIADEEARTQSNNPACLGYFEDAWEMAIRRSRVDASAAYLASMLKVAKRGHAHAIGELARGLR